MLPGLVSCILLNVIGSSDPPDRPPPLTFDKHVDYIAWYNDFVSKGKKDNAYELYKSLDPDEQGHGGFPELDGQAAEQYLKAIKRTWKPDEYPELAAYLKECAPYTETFQKAVKRRSYWQPAPDGTKLLDVCVLSTASSKNSYPAARVIIAQALMKQEGQPKAVLDACRIVLKSADHMHQSCFLTGVLSGTGRRALVYQLACVALSEDIIDGKDMALLYKTIRRYDPASADQTRWLYIEYAMQLDTLQFVFPNGRFNAPYWNLILAVRGKARSTPPAPPAALDPRETALLIDEHFHGIADIASMPFSLATARKLAQFEADQSAKIKENSFLDMLTWPFSRSYQLQLRAEAVRRGTLLTLALHAHHAKHGKWPASLKNVDRKLGLKGLKGLREDPFSGKDFIYKLKHGQPLLYSVSSNGKDDGGRHDKKWGEDEADSDYVFWPLQQ